MALSTAPVRTEQGLSPRHVVLRVFATWDGESYTVLPGGLTRVSTEDRSLVVSMQLGGGSKDTWVLATPGSPHESERSHKVTSAATLAIGIEAPRSTGELPSRVADNLFWLGRYAERAGSRRCVWCGPCCRAFPAKKISAAALRSKPSSGFSPG